MPTPLHYQIYDSNMCKEKKFYQQLFQICLLLLLLPLSPNWVHAQAIDTFSLDQCIDIALKNNKSIQNKRLDELINQAKIEETKADLYPQLTFNGSYQYYLNVPKSLVSSALFGGPPSEFTYSEFQVAQSVSASADLSFQVYNPAILAALKINKLSKDMSVVATKDKLEAVMYDVSATYLNIQINELQIGLTRSNIANLKKNVDLTTQLLNQGLALPSDIDNLNVSVVNLETVLSNQLTGLKQLYYLLKIYMGLPPNYTLAIEKYKQKTTDFTPILASDTTLYATRNGYVALRQTGSLLQLERNSIKAGALPVVNLIGSFGYNGLNTDLTLFKPYDSKWNPVNLVQLNVTMPIFDGFKKRGQLVKNKYQLLQNQNSLLDLKHTFQMEQMNALDQYNHYVQDLQYQNKNMALANKLYTQKQLEYQNNSATLNDMIVVENTLKSAQANYLNTLVRLHLAALDLKKANGQLGLMRQ